MELVTIYTTLNATDAQLVRSRLEAAGLHAIIAYELSTLSLAAGGVRVQVPEDEAADARELLDAPPVEPPAAE